MNQWLNDSMNQVKKWAAAALSGFFLVACLPKLNLHPLVWIALVPLLLALTSETNPWRAFALAYLSGAVFLGGSCYWFVGVTQQYGGLSQGLALLALLLFLVVFSFFFGAFGLVVGCVARKSPALALLLSPFLWVAIELARTFLITGFPWNLLGYGVSFAGLRQIASVTGIYGLSFLAAASSALTAWAILRWRSRWPRVALAGWAALLLIGNWALAPPAPAQGLNMALLLQPNVPLDEPALDAWIPWRDSAQLQQLVNLSVSTVDKFMNRPMSATLPGAPPASGPPLLV